MKRAGGGELDQAAADAPSKNNVGVGSSRWRAKANASRGGEVRTNRNRWRGKRNCGRGEVRERKQTPAEGGEVRTNRNRWRGNRKRGARIETQAEGSVRPGQRLGQSGQERTWMEIVQH